MYDLAVIGLGPAGIELVQEGLKRNLKIIAFEKAELGGTCLNVGCIPTKSILHLAEVCCEIKNIQEFNQEISLSCNWQKIIKRNCDIISKFNKALDLSFSKKIELQRCEAKIVENNDNIEILADNKIYFAKNIVIATGSKPIELDSLKFDNKFILNSDDLFKLDKLPKSIAIVGSGAIGLEWALILKTFNVEVKLIEKASSLAPALDIDLQKRIERLLKTHKIEFFKNDYIEKVENNTVVLNSNKTFEVENILVAVGRKPNISNFENLQIKSDFSTNFKNVYVIGDAIGKIMLAHSASYQAKQLINKLFDKKILIDKNIPSVIYTFPQIASIGLREQDIEDKEKYTIKKVLLGSLAKSWCDNSPDGMVKVILKDNVIKGAHIVSPEASSLISIFNVLIEKKVTVDEISEMIFPHPSYSELIQEVLK